MAPLAAWGNGVVMEETSGGDQLSWLRGVGVSRQPGIFPPES